MRFSILMAALVLAGCSGETEEATTPPSEAMSAPAEAPPAETTEVDAPDVLENVDAETPNQEPVILSGKHCYFSQTEQETEALEVEFAESGKITGYHYGAIHDAANAYYAAFDIDLSNGQLADDGGVTFDSVIEVDGDTQSETVAWVLTEEAASNEFKTLAAAACEGLMERVRPPIE